MESARVLVAQQERHLGDGQLAVAQEGQRQVVAELGEHRAKRRPLFAQPALERPGAHPEHTPHALQAGDPGAQLGPQQLAHLVVEGVRAPEGREALLGKVVEIAGQGGVGRDDGPGEIVVPEQEGGRQRAEFERRTVESLVLPHVLRAPVRELHGQGGDGGRGDFPAQRQHGRESKVRRRSEGAERRFHVQAHPRGIGLCLELDDEGVRQEAIVAGEALQRCRDRRAHRHGVADETELPRADCGAEAQPESGVGHVRGDGVPQPHERRARDPGVGIVQLLLVKPRLTQQLRTRHAPSCRVCEVHQGHTREPGRFLHPPPPAGLQRPRSPDRVQSRRRAVRASATGRPP